MALSPRSLAPSTHGSGTVLAHWEPASAPAPWNTPGRQGPQPHQPEALNQLGWDHHGWRRRTPAMSSPQAVTHTALSGVTSSAIPAAEALMGPGGHGRVPASSCGPQGDHLCRREPPPAAHHPRCPALLLCSRFTCRPMLPYPWPTGELPPTLGLPSPPLPPLTLCMGDQVSGAFRHPRLGWASHPLLAF